MTTALVWALTLLEPSALGSYSKTRITSFGPSGQIIWSEIQEQILPPGTIYGRWGQSYARSSNGNRVFLSQRDERTYEVWWMASPLGVSGRFDQETPRSDLPSFEVSGAETSSRPLAPRKKFGITFPGRESSFSDGSRSRYWEVEGAGDRIILREEGDRRKGRHVRDLLEYRPARPNEWRSWELSALLASTPEDIECFMPAYEWVLTGRWKSPAAFLHRHVPWQQPLVMNSYKLRT